MDLFSRHAELMTAEALADTRVVVVNGARQVGKSTLAELIAARSPGARVLYLDDQAVRAAAESDPSAFVRHDGLLMIDEIQRVPELLLAIKREVDRDRSPGRFLLTGSARLLGLRDLPDALPGRAETIELWPLSQGEIDSAPDGVRRCRLQARRGHQDAAVHAGQARLCRAGRGHANAIVGNAAVAAWTDFRTTPCRRWWRGR
jgi:AAA domain